MANNVVEIAIRGIDDVTKVIKKIENNFNNAFGDIESTIKSIPDLDIDSDFSDVLSAEMAINEVESAIGSIPSLDIASDVSNVEKAESKVAEVESAIKSVPDLDIQADMSGIQKVEGAIDGVSSAIKSIPDPDVDTSGAVNDFKKLQDEVDKTEDKIKGIDMGSLAGGLAAGMGISEAIDKALSTTSLDTQIEITFDVPPESIAAVKNATKTIESYGIDAESSLEGVRRQWALNTNASDEANKKIVQGAGVIASAYNGVDFTELIQEINEISSELDITNENALGLTNSLLKAGFPPEQLDIIAEYGKQLSDAGYTAGEIQAIFQAGVDTGTWNIDNLLDGLKEGRILVGEFGAGVDESMAELLKGTGISAKQLQEWGKAVAGGGETGSVALREVASALNNVEDETTKNLLGVKLFGTMYEDQGQNIIDTLINSKDAVVDLKGQQDALNQSVDALESSPAVEMKQAMSDLTTAMSPVFVGIANVVSSVSNWVSENPKLAATIFTIISVLGIMMGIFMALAPIITAVATVAGVAGISFTAMAAPILIVIGVIGALIAVIWLLVSNWDSVSQWLSASWEWLKELAVTVFGAIGEFFKGVWEGIKSITEIVWNGIKDFFSGVWNWIVEVFKQGLEKAQTFISSAWQTIKNVTSTVWNGIKTFFSTIWNGIKTVFQTSLNVAKTVITTVWNGIKTVTSNVWNGIKITLGTIITSIKRTFEKIFNGISEVIGNVWEGIKTTTGNVWDGLTGTIKGAVNGIIGIINGMIGALNKIKIKLPQVPDWVPGLGGKGGQTLGFNIPKIPQLATGGLAVSETLAIIGEGADEEAVLPLNNGVMSKLGSRIAANMDMPTSQGGSITYVDFDYKIMAEYIAEAIEDKFDPLFNGSRDIKILVQNVSLLIRVLIQSLGPNSQNVDIMQLSRELQKLNIRSKTSKGEGIG